MEKDIFVIGVGRSGTSLLQSILHTHSQIGFVKESQFIKHYMPFERQKKAVENQGPLKFKEKIINDEYLNRGIVDFEELFEPYFSGKEPFLLESIFRRFKKISLKNDMLKYTGEKDARNLDFLKIIKKYFPEAKVVLIYRDPRDTVLSKTKAAWSASRPYWMHSIIGNAQLSRGLKSGKKYFRENFYTVKYEDLLVNPEMESKKLCVFLEVPFEEKMLEFQKSAKGLFEKKRELQYKFNNFKPIQKNNFDKWKKELTPFQISLIQTTNLSLIRQLKYELMPINNSYFEKVILKFFQVINFIFKHLYWLIVRIQIV